MVFVCFKQVHVSLYTCIAPPDIEESKLRNSVVAEGENTSFVCSARGYPPPMLTWFLNGTRVLPQDRGTMVYERSSQSGLYNVTTSELVIPAAQLKLNGEVQCTARSTTAAIDLTDDNETALLVVLGKIINTQLPVSLIL